MMRKATQSVPFSSLFYTSRPLESALTRKPTQFFFILIGLYFLRTLKSSSTLNINPRSQVLRFSVLEQRDGTLITDPPLIDEHHNSSDAHHLAFSSTSPISSLGVMLNGQDLKVIPSTQILSKSSVIITFLEPVEFDGWYFSTSLLQTSQNDPVRFVLHAYEEKSWRIVGSSSYWKFYSGVVFFHSFYRTSTNRGHRENFDVFSRRPHAEYTAAVMAPVVYITMGILGALKQEHLAIYVYSAQSVMRILISASLADRSQTINCLLCFFLALPHALVLLLVSRGLWTLSFMQLGLILFVVGLVVSPFPFYGTRHPGATLLSISAPYLASTLLLQALPVYPIVEGSHSCFYLLIESMLLATVGTGVRTEAVAPCLPPRPSATPPPPAPAPSSGWTRGATTARGRPSPPAWPPSSSSCAAPPPASRPATPARTPRRFDQSPATRI